MSVTNKVFNVTNETPTVTLAELKNQLNIEQSQTDQDALITSYLAAAVAWVENYINGKIFDGIYSVNLDEFANYTFDIWPVRYIDEIRYYKTGEALETTLSTDDYHVRQIGKKTIVVFDNIPSDVDADRFDAVTIDAAVGYDDDDPNGALEVSELVKQAIRLIVTDMYERRENRPGVSVSVAQNILRPLRYYL